MAGAKVEERMRFFILLRSGNIFRGSPITAPAAWLGQQIPSCPIN